MAGRSVVAALAEFAIRRFFAILSACPKLSLGAN